MSAYKDKEKTKAPFFMALLGKEKPKEEGDDWSEEEDDDDAKVNAAKGVREALQGDSDEDLAEALETFLKLCSC